MINNRGWLLMDKKDKKDHSDKEDSLSFLETVENRLFFYSEITSEKALQLNKSLIELQNRFIADQLIRSSSVPDTIYLHINSPGGSVFDSLSICDEICNLKVPLVSIVDGVAASGASLISVSAKKRLIKKRSFILIHQLSTFFWGKYEELKDEKENCDKLMACIRDIYLTRTKMPEEKLNDILKRDVYLTSSECLDYGLVDEII